MFDRYTFPSLALLVLTCLALLVFGVVGCEDRPSGEFEPAATPETQQETPVATEIEEVVEIADADPGSDADVEAAAEAEADDPTDEPEEAADTIADQIAESEREEDRHNVVVDEDIARRHIGAWIAEGGRLAGSMFIFTEGGHAQMGNHAMMFSGEYTIDYSHDDPHLFIRVDVMGRTVDTHFFIEYLPDDRLRFHLAALDENAPGGVRRQPDSQPMLLVRDE